MLRYFITIILVLDDGLKTIRETLSQCVYNYNVRNNTLFVIRINISLLNTYSFIKIDFISIFLFGNRIVS